MADDQILNTTPDYVVTHTFSTDDVTGTFDGLTQGDVQPGEIPVIDFTAEPKVTKEGVQLYPINSEFGFIVTDFDGAVEKDFLLNPEYAEGWAGDLKGIGGEQIGIVVSDSPTDTFKTPALLGTWLAGIGGNTVKASTEHYTVMQNVLSDQLYPGDPNAVYPLDDNLRMVGGQYDGMYISDILPIIGDVNGDGVADIRDALQPNESTITENIAVSDDYSVTLKDDGKLLYRWGNTVKRPNDIRMEVEMELPDEWSDNDTSNPEVRALYKITSAELLVNHTITNNPNDQIRPEDYENETAIGQLPTYQVLPDGKWVSTDDYYAGDGTFYPAGTVLRDPALAAAVAGSTLDQIGALSEDLELGFTNAWYTTMDREPFEADLNDAGTDYDVGPRWRLQPDKYGQDLPGVEIPLDPSLPPPPTQDQVKYEVGADTQTVINLLDWEFPISPLSISAGWQNEAGTVTENGLNRTENFDVAFYVKGDIKPATLYNTQLVLSYEQIDIQGFGEAVSGGAGEDYLVGLGGNTFTGGAASDLFVLSYAAPANWADIVPNTVTDFEVGTDTIGLFDFGITDLNFSYVVSQEASAGGLDISIGGTTIATLQGVSDELSMTDFLLLNRNDSSAITGTEDDDYLVGDAFDNVIYGLGGDDTLLGLAGDDHLYGGADDDVLEGGEGADILDGGEGFDTATYENSNSGVEINLITNVNVGGDAESDLLLSIEEVVGSSYRDVLNGDAADNVLRGGEGDDSLNGGPGDDQLFGEGGNDYLRGQAGADVLDGGADIDWAFYDTSASRVAVYLNTGVGSYGDAQGDTLIFVENVKGSLYNDVLSGDNNGNYVRGNAGNDWLRGLGGLDYLRGDEGSDRFVFWDNADIDVVLDFQNDIDILQIDADLYGGGKTAQQIVDDFGVQNGADAYLNFADGESFRILNTELADIVDDIAII